MISVTLEYLRGQYEMDSAHLRHGIQLLSNMSTYKPTSTISPNILSPAEDFAHKALIDLYARLSIQSAMLGYIPSQMCIITRDRQTNLPYTFASMVEARQTLDDLLNRIHCLEQYYNNQSNPDISSAQLKIRTDLSLWRKTFSTTAFLRNPTTPQDQFGSTLLRVYYERPQ